MCCRCSLKPSMVLLAYLSMLISARLTAKEVEAYRISNKSISEGSSMPGVHVKQNEYFIKLKPGN